MITTADMIEHYMAEIDSMADLGKRSDNPLDMRAVVAFSHMVDNCATLEDLTTYRAWISYLRLDGMSDHDLRGSIAVADDTARKLGVA